MHPWARGRLALLAAAVVAVAFLPAAHAARVDGQVVATGTVELVGRFEGTLGVAEAWNASPQGLVLAAGASTFTVYEQGAVQAPGILVPLPVREVASGGAAGATFTAREGATALLRAERAAQASFNLTGLQVLPSNEATYEPGFLPGADPWGVLPRGACGVVGAASSQPWRLAAPVRMLLQGGVLAADGEPVLLGDTPAGTRFAVLETSDVVLHGWSACATTVAGHLAGRVALTGVEGSVQVGAGSYDAHAARFQAAGTFALEATHDGTRTSWRLAGEAEALALDDEPVAQALLAVGASAVLLATLGYLASRMPGLFVWAGYHRAAPLGHPRRVQLLEVVRANPGETLAGISDALGIGRTTARFHARVLLRAGELGVVRRGRTEHFRSLTGPSAAEALGAAASQHPVRQLILGVLRGARRPLDYAGLVQEAAVQGLTFPSQSLASYHLAILAEAGLVLRRRVGKRVLWSVPPVTQAEASPGPLPSMASVEVDA